MICPNCKLMMDECPERFECSQCGYTYEKRKDARILKIKRLMLKWNIETLHNYNILTDKEYEEIYDRVNKQYPKK